MKTSTRRHRGDRVTFKLISGSESAPKMNGIIWSPNTLYWAWTIICMPKMNIMMPLTCTVIIM